MSARRERECIAGIDYGTVRIGIALVDMEIPIATPFENYTRGTEEDDAKYFARLADQQDVVRFVVGLPVHLSGDDSTKSHEARQFGQWLGDLTCVPVEFFDDRFTTSFARQLMEGVGLTKKKRKARLDKLSAQLLLSAYLEREQGKSGHLLGLDDKQ